MMPRRHLLATGLLAGLFSFLALGCRTESADGLVAPQSDKPSVSESEAPPAAPEPDEPMNVIKWSTASEVDNFGYDIYRGEAEEGPFERVNEEPLEGAGTTDEVSAYRYEDKTIDPYKQYFYYVESISMSGERETFTPVFASKAKLTRADEG